MNTAVILSAGVGSRFSKDDPHAVHGQTLPKQFQMLDNRTVLETTVQKFEDHPLIDEIIIVSHADYLSRTQELVRGNPWRKVTQVVPGGAQRAHSSAAAINFLCKRQLQNTSPHNVLFHDVARPWVSSAIITRVLHALDSHEAVNVVIKVTDTLLKANATGCFVEQYVDREAYRQVQTPQGFHLETIAKAYSLWNAAPHFIPTDDCSLVQHYLPHVPIYLAEGNPQNTKITYFSDLQ